MSSEAYLVNILEWVVMRNPGLMMKKDAELRITLSTVLDARDHTALLETLRTAVIGSVVKGRCWKEKLKLRRLSTVGYQGYSLHHLAAYAPMLAILSEWQITALLAGVGRN